MVENQGKLVWSVSILASLLYSALLVWISSYHELWRDEVRALSIASAWRDLSELFSLLKNEGHPVLWYLGLSLSRLIFGQAYALQGLSIIVAFFSTLVFLRFSPFSRFVKLLWLMGFYPIYEYSIVCRNYSLSMFGLFLCCSVYSARFRHPLLFATLLLLLAHSSFYGTVLCLALGLAVIFESILIYSKSKVRLSFYDFLATAVWIFACVSAVLQMQPDANSIVLTEPLAGVRPYLKAAIQGFFSHGSFAHNAFGLPFFIAGPLVFVASYIFNIRRPSLVIFLVMVIVAVEVLHRNVYSALALRHQGFLFLSVVTAVWLGLIKAPEVFLSAKKLDFLDRYRLRIADVAMAVLLLPQTWMAYGALSRDIHYPMSNAYQLGEFIRTKPQLASAIILVEPDYLLDTLPIYLTNRLYLAREKKFGTWVSFTKQTESSFSISKLLLSGLELCEIEKNDILFVLSDRLEAGNIKMLYGKEFFVEPGELTNFYSHTEQLAKFTSSILGEDYLLFRLKKDCSSAN